MPYVPSGILYFMVWKYGLFGALLLVGTLIVKSTGGFQLYPLEAVTALTMSLMLPLLWFEHGDAKLRKQWRIDAERSNCDRMAKALLYVFCCIFWPKFVSETDPG